MASERIRREPGSGDANYSTSTSDARGTKRVRGKPCDEHRGYEPGCEKCEEACMVRQLTVEERFRALDHTDPREEAELSALLQGGTVERKPGWPGAWVVVVRDGRVYVPILRQDQLHRLIPAVRAALGSAWEIGPLDNGGWCMEWWEGEQRHVMDCKTLSGAIGLAWYRSINSAD